MIAAARLVVLLVLAIGCGPRIITETTEVPLGGACAELRHRLGGTCQRHVIERAVVASTSVPLDDDGGVSGSLAYRNRYGLISLDHRRPRRAMDPRAYETLAVGATLQISGIYWAPESVRRYLDLGGGVGFDGGMLKFGTGLRGRGDWHLDAYVELAAPDIGPLRYFDKGVPGIRVGVRWTDYAREWLNATSLEVGLVWRWGWEVEVHSYKRWYTPHD